MNRLRAAPATLFWAGFALWLASFITTGVWRNVDNGAVVLAGVGLAALLLALAMCRLGRISATTALTLVWVCALAYFLGFAAVAAVVLMAVAALAIGSLLVPDGDGHILLSILLGMALVCGLDGWLLPFRLHWRALYFGGLVAVALVRRRAVVPLLNSLGRQWSVAIGASPCAALMAIVGIGLATAYAWPPVIHYDALAYHSALPSQLAEFGYYQMNAGSNIWALAPWAADVAQGIARVLAGSEATGAVAVFWLALTLALLWRLAAVHGLAPWLRWLGVVLYAVTPSVAGLLTSMQTEGPTAAVLAGLALLICGTAAPTRRHLLTAGALFGLLLALKVSNLLFAAPLGLWLLWRWRCSLPWRAAVPALVLCLMVAGSSYLYAYLLTGNPVLPVFNAVFHSPFYAQVNFHDGNWDHGLVWDLPWELVFHTSAYMEARDGEGPFALVALGGSLLAALLNPRYTGLALVGIVCFALPLTQLQYLRYSLPALVLLVPAMLGGIGLERSGRWRLQTATALWLLVAAELAFVPYAYGPLNKDFLPTLLDGGSRAVLSRYVPERLIADLVRQRYGKDMRMLVLDKRVPYTAEQAGRAFNTSWYDPLLSQLHSQSEHTDSPADWRELFRRSGANLLVVAQDQLTPGLQSAIADVDGERVYGAGNLWLWELHQGHPGRMLDSSTSELRVGFDLAQVPGRASLMDAHVELACDPRRVVGGQLVASWEMQMQGKKPWRYSTGLTCTPSGRAQAEVAAAVPRRPIGLSLTVRRDPVGEAGLVVLSSSATVRADLTADRDLAHQLRRKLVFWNKRPAESMP